MHEVIKLLFWAQALYIVNLFYNFHKILGAKNNVGIRGVSTHLRVCNGVGGNCLGCWKGLKW
jgi:hypothetical protein